MKILLCPDKFKGSISAKKVCKAIGVGLMNGGGAFEILHHPMADGGDGSIEILKDNFDLEEIVTESLDPLARKISASYYISKKTAFIELASASGLVLLKDDERNPCWTSTEGTGVLIKHALRNGCKKIYLFIGGSATNDAGMGIAHVLGFHFVDKNGAALKPIGDNLLRIERVLAPKYSSNDEAQLIALCDVNNPMFGPNGAAYTYAKQKGATSQEIEKLDQGLQHYAAVLKAQYGVNLSKTKGVGAAGAVCASLLALLNAEMQSGFQMLSELTQLEQRIKEADVIVTGEGKIDSTSFQGKVVGNVFSLCKKYSKPCVAVGGIIEETDQLIENCIYQKSIFSKAQSLKRSMAEPEKYLQEIGLDISQFLRDQKK